MLRTCLLRVGEEDKLLQGNAGFIILRTRISRPPAFAQVSRESARRPASVPSAPG